MRNCTCKSTSRWDVDCNGCRKLHGYDRNSDSAWADKVARLNGRADDFDIESSQPGFRKGSTDIPELYCR